MMKKTIIVVLVLLLLPALAFSQSSTGGRSRSSSTYTLTVTCNVPNATVQIAGEGTAKLGSVSGRAPFSQSLAPGTYTVTVSAAGYNPETRTINLASDQTVNFNLEHSMVTLSVTSNVAGARVRIQGNGQNVSGNADMSAELPPGIYQVAIAAQGYRAQSQRIELKETQTLSFVLEPLTAKVAIVLGPKILNPRLGNPSAQVKIFDNGQPLRGLVSDMNPGQHTIRVESGGFSFEITLILEAGKEYKIEPYGGFIINDEKM